MAVSSLERNPLGPKGLAWKRTRPFQTHPTYLESPPMKASIWKLGLAVLSGPSRWARSPHSQPARILPSRFRRSRYRSISRISPSRSRPRGLSPWSRRNPVRMFSDWSSSPTSPNCSRTLPRSCVPSSTARTAAESGLQFRTRPLLPSLPPALSLPGCILSAGPASKSSAKKGRTSW